MKNDAFLREILQSTKIIRPPKHMLATFGPTTLRYVLLSDLPQQPGYCRLREGEVVAQRPAIMHPEALKKHFEGFGEDAAEFEEQFARHYGDSLRGLEYTFRNELRSTSLEHAPLPEVTERALKVMAEEDAARMALLEGPDARWSLSIMKFILDMSLRSFPGNVRELDERGLFDPARRQEMAWRQSIETLFRQAQNDPSMIQRLGQTLKESGLFTEYEDRFFALVRH